MSDRTSIRLAGQAKIAGKWRKPGEDVAVTADELRDLVAAGVVAVDADDATTTMAETADDTLAEAIRERDEWRSLQRVAEDQVVRLEARVLELEDELSRSEEARQDLEAQMQALQTPSGPANEKAADDKPAEKAASKTTPKKGAGGGKG